MTKRSNKILEYSVVAAIIAVVIALLGPPAVSDRQPYHRESCRHRLRTLGLALQNYHVTYGSFPPAFLSDANGRPIHSWRVLLLPFLDQQALYDEYHFDEPWDGPRNTLLHERAMNVLGHNCFSCSADGKDMKQTTTYLAVVGSNTSWPGNRPRSKDEFRDGLANSILIVEVYNSGIHCLEPRDLSFDEMCFGINDPGECGIRSNHRSNTSSSLRVKSANADIHH
ncbi:MAG: DUF1559 domain-containing protein [Planctomycetaceae bacterium]|nr:DUF1559 domain-containing protein [Planctomycetaceae bacterium]